jgi:hypothetical protein
VSSIFNAPSPLVLVRRYCVSMLEAGEFKLAADGVNEEFLHHAISEAYVELNTNLGLLWDTDTQNLVAGQVYYDRPGHALYNTLHPAQPLQLDLGSDTFVYPKLRNWTYMRERYGEFDDMTPGTPAEFCLAPVTTRAAGLDVGRFVLAPPASVSVTDGWRLTYLRHPGRLDTIHFDTDGAGTTASVTSDGTTVTLSADPGGIGDHAAFGTRTSTSRLPTTWHRVQSKAGAVLTLSDGYIGSTDADALYCLSDCSELEWCSPGLIRPADIGAYVAMRYAEMTNEAMVPVYSEKWEAAVARMRGRNRFNETEMESPVLMAPAIARRR